MERHSEVVLETALVSLCTLDIGLKIIIIINNKLYSSNTKICCQKYHSLRNE